ncbi:MAG: hypothetical protein ACRYF3_09615 [Janthinobacterium lividum]
MRNLQLAVGIVLIVAGILWLLQGLDVMGGSAMSGSSTWTIVGPIIAVLGIVLVVASRRRARR